MILSKVSMEIMNQRVTSGSNEIPNVLDDEEPSGHAPNESTTGFGAETTAPDLHRSQRQLYCSPPSTSSR